MMLFFQTSLPFFPNYESGGYREFYTIILTGISSTCPLDVSLDTGGLQVGQKNTGLPSARRYHQYKCQ